MSREAAGDPAVTSSIVVIAALGVERAPLERMRNRMARGVAVVQSGPGAKLGARAAREALARGAAGLVSWGLAGGLDASLAPGAIVVPSTILEVGGAAWAVEVEWRAALIAALGAAQVAAQGPLLTVAAALETPAAKRAAAAASGAVAADMESAAIAAAAADAGVPFVAVRVVVDTLGDSLPPRAERWVDAHGDRRLAPVVGAAFHPLQWPSLWLLASRYRAARRSLELAADRLSPLGFAASAHAGARRTG